MLAVGVAVVDAIGIGTDHPEIRMVNYLFCWAAIYQLGIAWHGGLLRRGHLLTLAVASAAVLAVLVTWGPYPIAMIGVSGDRVENSAPPSLALLALAGVQAGVLLAIAPAVNRGLQRGRRPGVVAVANNNVMALYLWHMLPVVIVTLVRLEWEAVLMVVTVALLALLWWQCTVFASALTTFVTPVPQVAAESMIYAGTASCALALGLLAAGGFAPGGHFPVAVAVLFTVGALLVAARPRITFAHR